MSLAARFADGQADSLDAKDTAFLVEALFRYGEIALTAAVAQRRLRLQYPVTAFDTLATQYDLLRTYDLTIPPSKGRSAANTQQNDGLKVISLFYDALSFRSTGYTFRTQNILKHTGLDVRAYTRVGFPWAGGLLKGDLEQHKTEADGIVYRHIRGKVNNQNEIFLNIGLAKHEIRKVLAAETPGIVHAASNFTNALPALLAARECGIPFIYEMRGFWEMTSGVGVAGWFESERYALESRIETLVARSSDAVIVLSDGQKRALVERGVRDASIHVVPNFHNWTSEAEGKASPLTDDAVVREFTEGGSTLGYLGSITEYEGIQDLMPILASGDGLLAKARLLVVGDGPYLGRLKQLVEVFGLAGRVMFLGRVPRAEVGHLYDLIDVCLLPRLPGGVTELVPPLKFVEVIARGKVLLASNVAAMAELVDAIGYGELFAAGDSDDLRRQLGRILTDLDGLKERYGRAAQLLAETYSWERGAALWDSVVSSVSHCASDEVSTESTAADAIASLYESRDLHETRKVRAWRRLGHFRVPQTERGRVLLRTASFEPTATKVVVVDERMEVAEVVAASASRQQPDIVELDLAGNWSNAKTVLVYSRREAAEAARLKEWEFLEIPEGGISLSDARTLGRLRLDPREIVAVEIVPIAGESITLNIVSDYREAVRTALSFVPLPGAKLAHDYFRLSFSKVLGARFQYGEIQSGENDISISPRLTGSFMLEITPWQGGHQLGASKFHPIAVVHQRRRDSASFVRLPERTVNVLIAADLNENLLDGSAIWLSTLVEQIAAAPSTNVFVATNSVYLPNSIFGEIFSRHNVAKIDLDLRGQARVPEMARRLVEIDRVSGGFDAIIVRGIELARHLDRRAIRDRVILYGVGVVAPDTVAGKVLRDPQATSFASRFAGIIFQNKLTKDIFLRSYRHYKGACYLVPPSVDEALLNRASADQVLPTRRGRIAVYAGKLERSYGVLEFLEAVKKSAARGGNFRGVILGNKLNAHDSEFPREFESLRKQLGKTLTWIPSASRVEALSWMKAANAVWGWRHAQFESSHFEISTKMIEAICCGTPIVLYPTQGNVDLLGASYAGFASSSEEAIETLYELTCSPPSDFRKQCQAVARRFSARAAHRQLLDALRPGLPEADVGRKRHGIHGGKGVASMPDRVQPPEGHRILVASHDFRFFEDIEARLMEDRVPVHREYWKNHSLPKTAGQELIADQCDRIVSEWCLGNAVWWSNNLRDNQRLIIRFHLQELQTDYPARVNYDYVTKLIFVSPHVMREAQAKFRIPAKICEVIPVGVPFDLGQPPDERDNFSRRDVLGVVGITPWRKRPDLALDLLSRLRANFPDLKLFIKGGAPSDYPWLETRSDELAKYQQLFSALAPLQEKGFVRFDGYDADMENFYRQVGWILSLSDFEGCHTSVAEGGTMGCIPLMLGWSGASEVYPEWLVQRDLDTLVAFFQDKYPDFHNSSVVLQRIFKKRFAADLIFKAWQSALFEH